MKDCCSIHKSLSESIDIFIRVHTRHKPETVRGKDLKKVKDVRDSVKMSIMERRIRTPDAGPGPTYRLIYSENPNFIVLISVYPKNIQEKIPLDVINRHMSNIPSNCESLEHPFIELFGETCKSII